MDKPTIIKIIKLQLGASTVNIEISDEDIDLLLQVATNKVLSVVGITKLQEVQAVPCQDFNSGTVIRVFNNTITMGLTPEIDDVFSVYNLITRGTSMTTMKNSIIYNAYSSFTRDVVNKSFYYKQGKLYLYNYTGTVTVEYIPREVSIEDLDELYLDWVIRYTKALCKETLGRVRGKFKSSSSPFEVDSDLLLSESETEKSQLLDELNNMGFFYVDTD